MKMQDLKNKMRLLADKIRTPHSLIPEVNESNDFAKPYIDMGMGDVFYYVIRERGVEYERILFRNESELLFRIFKDITFEMAIKYELNNRIEGQDFRILLFKKQEELIAKLNSEWAKTLKIEHNDYLKL
ncbi:Imm63 family immunity protein [Epilithonimonas sp. UC225_85]|uniref:Imm63 family immunity protein n=1 Tax=Epilithonimonas sp. UC225_85 TaxID=3350167 RepID=UPI0036D30825